jgi:hypothetical protein
MIETHISTPQLCKNGCNLLKVVLRRLLGLRVTIPLEYGCMSMLFVLCYSVQIEALP